MNLQGYDFIVQVDMYALIDAGADVYRSANNVYLTSGLWKDQVCLGIRPE